ncbi:MULTISPECIES: ATP-binding protein [Dyadobacter]|uniref:histidine kinase n=1 Tax=Dyadobacter chenhuakuii TaxID=2909339 RepID=A0A9X1TTZ3_9BACT|nr:MULTISPECIES: ATP-binding protein [Dyadobacter]MCE7071395.1 ATP-binding protein [Dyadobacter sp. CY327]MCF2493718.1 ATP-binding protein [Dyadobacter chenhuakuii]MCF2500769.1 ATP-binding protein [Dyadobacter chenhuakuii]MCF2517967.1 ATP-binding protein [Dyadobacter sp. CY351]USJ30853.1 ATP-binding protein [Dyadobacter chenhuakuii]
MNTKLIRVLLVDDDEDDYFLTREYFQELVNWKFDITWCSTFRDAQQHIKDHKYDLYLFDYLLGESTGIDLIELACQFECEEPIILLTGKGDTKIAVEALRLGAADYLIKSELDSEKLERSIRYALERTSVLKALKHSERRYRRIFEESNDFLFISDLAGNIIDLNASASVLTGYTEDDLRLKNILELLEDAQFDSFWNNIKDHPIHDLEVRLVTKDGDKKYCLFSATLEVDDDHPYIQGRLHDMTARKQSERERLFSEKMAVTGRLVRMLAHEVRNPLTNVNLSAEQLEMELVDEDQKFYTQIIKRNCNRINDLISQLLQPSSSADIELVTSSVHTVLIQAIGAALDRVQLKRIQIVNQFAEEEMALPLDPVSLQMAFLNIITNAIEAMEEDKGILRITTKSQGENIQVIFTDNGCGISEEHMEKIFEPYFTGKNNGMGIGLSTTMSIIHAHHGRIDVESEIGTGTTFTITFQNGK